MMGVKPSQLFCDPSRFVGKVPYSADPEHIDDPVNPRHRRMP